MLQNIIRQFCFSVAGLLATFFVNAELVGFDDNRWSDPGTLHLMTYFGKPAALHSGGVTTLNQVRFVNGRIDVDVNIHGQRSFAGLVFRHQDDDNFELVYFRSHKSGLPDAVQYIPHFNGASTWQLYSEGYMAPAYFDANRWMHITLEFMDRTLSVYVDGKNEPALVVKDLQRDVVAGGIGLWGRPAMHFANFQYEVYANPSTDLPAQQTTPGAGVITNWSLSQVFEEAINPLTQPASADLKFTQAQVEGKGLVNISRFRQAISRQKLKRPSVRKDLVYARASFNADKQMTKKLWLGYSDEIMVYLNGEPVYEGHSAFNHRAPFALGILGMKNDALYLPLQKGENTIVLAVAEVFGGWGFMAEFENPEGLGL